MVDLSVISGLNILIVGLGREGVALAQFLSAHGIPTTATDLRAEETFGDAVVSSLHEAGVSLLFGQHPVTLLDEADLLFVSPGVPLETPFIQQAVEKKLPLCTESKLFCHLCPASIIAITGSSGKTTTTTLVGEIMAVSGRKTWVGGNIGQPLIALLDQIQPDEAVVMELSSFQLEYFHAKLNRHVDLQSVPAAHPEKLAQLLNNWSPPISALLNVTPNHLDRHPNMRQYVQAKRAIVDYQGSDDIVVMSLDNDLTRTIGGQFKDRVRWFSLEAQTPHGAGLAEDKLVFWDEDNQPQIIADKSEVELRGLHNLSNILAACLLTQAAGASLEAMREIVTNFTGVEHRLELVRQVEGVTYINDSIATTPERLMAALNAFEEPVVLLAGGRDKHLPWREAARLMLHKARAIILFGEAAPLIEKAVVEVKKEMHDSHTTIYQQVDLDDAVTLAAKLAEPGDVVLLSPGCASYDAFPSYVVRAQRFRELVSTLK